ncbi:RNA polymerase sigma factor [Mucilaginibacter gilvus]|uniref:RNA polymerase sigma factor SigS n=1 Tax=Mucilaginibacter gilvus TaxID=2305909 RepID=A0A3S3XAE0_9SPHI|nr:sigma-70 family RNA polymerase sigma factor [Mucilaginibacter gilvus]RWY54059.1 sigma-70 family RNA polymerase sigma factor [Mucilaginibacter gilvus]
MKNLSEQELLLQIRRDNHEAFDVLFDRHWARCYQSARARLNGSDSAQDIVQEIFIKLWQRRSYLNVQGPLENYLQSAVKLSVISHFRSKKVTEVQLEDALDRINMLEDSIDSITDYLELEKTLQQTVELMPEMLKRVYQLRSENLSVKAIAGELGLADQTVKNYISEVSRRLRIVIAEKHPEKHLTYMALIAAILYK